MRKSRVPGNEDKIELIVPVGRKVGQLVVPDYDEEGKLSNYTSTRPDDPNDLRSLEAYRVSGAKYLALEMDKFDQAGGIDLDKFANELGVKIDPKLPYDVKKATLKFELAQKTADQMGLAASQFNELITYKSSKGDYLPLAPRNVASVIAGLDLMSNGKKFLKPDLLAYAQIKNIPGRSTANTDELRKMAISNYIRTSESYLTVEEERKFNADKLEEEYGKR